jgi:glycosyltransferase 2 family protein
MEPRHRSLRRTIVLLVKLAVAAGLMAYVIYQAQQHERFRQLVEQPKNWALLCTGFICTFLSVFLSFLRWRILVVAIGIEFRTSEALRLGALGNVLNFISLGSLGGDFFKAVFLAHRQPGRRTEAIATVIVDRLMGLAIMLIIASAGILAMGLWKTEDAALRGLYQLILLSTVAGLVGGGLLIFVPALTGPKLIGWSRDLPLVGPTVARLLGAARAYRDRKHMLVQACAMSFVVDLLYVMSVYFVARGLPVVAPTFLEHMVIVPVASLAGAIPITPAGLGTLELATDKLYTAMHGVENGVGTIVTLAHRMTMVAVAVVGLIYYFAYRKEVQTVMAEAEELAEKDELAGAG